MRPIFLALFLAAVNGFASTVPKTLGDVTIVSSGRTQLSAAATKVYAMVIQAPSTNTGKIYVGDANVSATRGIELVAGQTITLSPAESTTRIEPIPINTIYCSSTVGADKVKVLYQSVIP